MAAYLFDTTVLSIYLDPTHWQHVEKRQSMAGLPVEVPRFISAVALAELTFGTLLAERIGKGNLPALQAIIAQARTYAVLELTHHTAAAYADLKARVAQSTW